MPHLHSQPALGVPQQHAMCAGPLKSILRVSVFVRGESIECAIVFVKIESMASRIDRTANSPA